MQTFKQKKNDMKTGMIMQNLPYDEKRKKENKMYNATLFNVIVNSFVYHFYRRILHIVTSSIPPNCLTADNTLRQHKTLSGFDESEYTLSDKRFHKMVNDQNAN